MNRSLLLYVLKRCHCTHLKVFHLHWVIEKLLVIPGARPKEKSTYRQPQCAGLLSAIHFFCLKSDMG
ncbi:MAG: hypothetical protein ABW185_19005 [Sedimenticola sp.]